MHVVDTWYTYFIKLQGFKKNFITQEKYVTIALIIYISKLNSEHDYNHIVYFTHESRKQKQIIALIQE